MTLRPDSLCDCAENIAVWYQKFLLITIITTIIIILVREI